jgi:hypothetical protein
MNCIRSGVVIISIALILSGVAAGQRRSRPKSKPGPPSPVPTAPSSPPKRPVTVNLKEGGPVTGLFLRADAESVQVEIQSGRLTIKLNEVDSLIFNSEEEPAKNLPQEAPDPAIPATRKAYTALRKLSDAATLRLPYAQYGNLLIEVRQVVEEMLGVIPESALKTEIVRAMDVYTDAGQAWGATEGKSILPINTEPGASLMRKYEIKPGVNAVGQADHLRIDTTLSTIWAAGGVRLRNIAALLNQ